MKKIKLLLTGAIMLCAVVLFVQCKRGGETSGKIPYNKEKAKVHFISVDTAAAYTSNFRKGRVQLMRMLRDTNRFNAPLAETFNRDAIAALLNQKGVTDVRIYLGQDNKGLIRLVLVGVDDKGNDITGTNGKIMRFAGNDENQTAVILEAGQRCPTLCAIQGSLLGPR